MELELRGNLVLERPPTRRWISIVAIVVPVVVCVTLTAWFIRVYVAPPMAAIPDPMRMAGPAPAPVDVDPPAPAVASPLPEPEPQQPAAQNEGTASAAPVQPPDAPAALPMFATLAVAPPSFETSMAPAEPVKDGALQKTEEPVVAAVETAAPADGPVPLPRSKPRVSVAAVVGDVPLPRARPADSATPAVPNLPVFDRHHPE